MVVRRIASTTLYVRHVLRGTAIRTRRRRFRPAASSFSAAAPKKKRQTFIKKETASPKPAKADAATPTPPPDSSPSHAPADDNKKGPGAAILLVGGVIIVGGYLWNTNEDVRRRVYQWLGRTPPEEEKVQDKAPTDTPEKGPTQDDAEAEASQIVAATPEVDEEHQDMAAAAHAPSTMTPASLLEEHHIQVPKDISTDAEVVAMTEAPAEAHSMEPLEPVSTDSHAPAQEAEAVAETSFPPAFSWPTPHPLEPTDVYATRAASHVAMQLHHALDAQRATLHAQFREELDTAIADVVGAEAMKAASEREGQLEEYRQTLETAARQDLEQALRKLESEFAERNNVRDASLQNLYVRFRALQKMLVDAADWQQMSTQAHRLSAVVLDVDAALEDQGESNDDAARTSFARAWARLQGEAELDMPLGTVVDAAASLVRDAAPATVDDLRDSFYRVAYVNALRVAFLPPEEEDVTEGDVSIWRQALAGIASKLTIRERPLWSQVVGSVDQDLATRRSRDLRLLRNVSARLQARDVVGAVADCETLSPHVRRACAEWESAARTHVVVNDVVAFSRARAVVLSSLF